MSAQRKLLYLQLPALDNDRSTERENVALGALCLDQALQNSDEKQHFTSHFLPDSADQAGNAGLVRLLHDLKPDVIAASLYLWNIERTLRVLRAVRRELPDLKVVVGGPEVAGKHPFLYRWKRAWDIAVVGEGESVFPSILRYVRGGPLPDYNNVAVRGLHTTFGRVEPPRVASVDALPPPAWQARDRVNPSVAYMETTRGCPMRCTYCRYHHLRRDVDVLPAERVEKAIRNFRDLGFHEVRFVDPTLNSHPRFTDVLRAAASANREKTLSLFAELIAHTITDQQADLLREANFTEIEIGIQSIDPRVLRAVARPTSLHALADGIQRLISRRINVTLDIMYGLPHQTRDDVYASIEWAKQFTGARIQCMQTLLLPGTDLRRERPRWKMAAGRRPPYGVRSTPWMSEKDMRGIEEYLLADADLPSDAPTARFVGHSLPDLFASVHPMDVSALRPRIAIPGVANRRALLFTGPDLFPYADNIARLIRRAIRSDPDTLWQFVLKPQWEEPLDVVDAAVDAARSMPRNQLDRYAGTELSDRMASRRVFLQLQHGTRYDPAWVDAAESALRAAFL